MADSEENKKIVFITGANRGIGLQFVRKLVTLRQYTVIAGCRNPEKATELKKTDVEVVKCDITSEEDIQITINLIVEKYSRVDLLINNAGVATKNHPHDLIAQVDFDEMQWVFNVNCVGTFRITRAFLPLLRKSSNPKVLTVSSYLGSIGMNEHGHPKPAGDKTSYRISKAALNMCIRCFAAEYPDIIFNSVNPGWVQTDMGSSNGRSPPLTPEQSVDGMMKVINNMSKEDTGAFFNHDGNEIPF